METWVSREENDLLGCRLSVSAENSYRSSCRSDSTWTLARAPSWRWTYKIAKAIPWSGYTRQNYPKHKLDFELEDFYEGRAGGRALTPGRPTVCGLISHKPWVTLPAHSGSRLSMVSTTITNPSLPGQLPETSRHFKIGRLPHIPALWHYTPDPSVVLSSVHLCDPRGCSKRTLPAIGSPASWQTSVNGI